MIDVVSIRAGVYRDVVLKDVCRIAGFAAK